MPTKRFRKYFLLRYAFDHGHAGFQSGTLQPFRRAVAFFREHGFIGGPGKFIWKRLGLL